MDPEQAITVWLDPEKAIRTQGEHGLISFHGHLGSNLFISSVTKKTSC